MPPPEPPLPPQRGPSADYTPTQAVGVPLSAGEAPGVMVVGKYQLVRRLATGGMGTVWEARDTSLERSVAIKFMAAAIASDPWLRERFAREAKAAARLRTPHVVQVFEHGTHQGVPFIVMELLHGEDLHRRLKRDHHLDLATAATVLTQTAKGLRVAHEAGIVHRDLKPHNVFLAIEDNELVVKVLDFGVAKVSDAAGESTKTGAVLGSPHYMSPEQARGLSTVDHRSDIWSLGVIAFRMITGEMAFAGEATGDVIVKICTEVVPPPSQLAPGLPAAVDAVFARVLERDLDRRYQSAVDFASAFAAAVEGHPAHADRGDALAGPTGWPTPAQVSPGDWAGHTPSGVAPGSPSAAQQGAASASSFTPAATPLGSMAQGGGPSSPQLTTPLPAGLGSGAVQGTPVPGSGATPSQYAPSHYTPSHYTPVTGPSVAGLAGSVRPHAEAELAPATSPPARRALTVVVALVTVAGAAAVIAAVSLGGPEPSTKPAALPSATQPAATPDDEDEEEPSSEPSGEPSSEPSAAPTESTASSSAEPSTSASAATPSVSAPPPVATGTPTVKPPVSEWGY